MTINRENFEAYLLDYLEGNLDPLLTADMMAFLAENPEYENLLPDGENTILIPDAFPFSEKEKLKKDFSAVGHITAANFEEFCIAESEGLLIKSESEKLHAYITENTGTSQILDIYGKIRLVPDLSIVFTDKLKLKHASKLVVKKGLVYYGLAIAAAIAIAVVLFKSSRSESSHQSTMIAETSDIRENDLAIEPQLGLSTEKKRMETKNSENNPSLSSKDIQTSVTFDSNTYPSLPMMKPLSSRIQYTSLPAVEFESYTAIHNSNAVEEIKDIPKEASSDNLLATLLSKVDIWKTAETAIDGFSQLTESQLSLNRITNDQGNTTRFVVNTERYSITGVMK